MDSSRMVSDAAKGAVVAALLGALIGGGVSWSIQRQEEQEDLRAALSLGSAIVRYEEVAEHMRALAACTKALPGTEGAFAALRDHVETAIAVAESGLGASGGGPGADEETVWDALSRVRAALGAFYAVVGVPTELPQGSITQVPLDPELRDLHGASLQQLTHLAHNKVAREQDCLLEQAAVAAWDCQGVGTTATFFDLLEAAEL